MTVERVDKGLYLELTSVNFRGASLKRKERLKENKDGKCQQAVHAGAAGGQLAGSGSEWPRNS